MPLLLRLLLIVPLLLVPTVSWGADVPRKPEITVAPDQPAAIAKYVRERAILHIIRATFDAESFNDLKGLVVEDLKQARKSGITAAQTSGLKTDLLTEGSYFIISIRYLIEAGFPAWPHDRTETMYRLDALSVLAPLPAELIAATESGDDPLPIFLSAAKVYWWTEGSQSPQDPRADFSQLDKLIDEATKAVDDGDSSANAAHA